MHKLVREVEGVKDKEGTRVEISVPNPDQQLEGEEFIWTVTKGWNVSIGETNKSQVRLAWIAVTLSAVWILWSTLDHDGTNFINTADLDEKNLTFVLTDGFTSAYMFDFSFRNLDMIIAFLVVIQWMYLALSVFLVIEIKTNPLTNLNLWFIMMICILALICAAGISAPMLRYVSPFWMSFFLAIQIYLTILWITFSHLNTMLEYPPPGCIIIA